MKKFTESAQDYFERHPLSNECHITSDDRVFHTKGAAQGFAGTLDNQDIESYSRKVLEKEITDTVKDGVDAGNDDKEAKLKELDSLELVTANYNQMKSLVKFFAIDTEDQKADTLISALTEFKTTLKQA